MTWVISLPDKVSGGQARLEVAMGLETVHPEVLARLNKRMTVETFLQAAHFLHDNDIDLRVFLLVRPPWLSEEEGRQWAMRSLDVAFVDARALVACVIPTRAGNGAMDALQGSGEFTPPTLASLEAVTEYGVRLCTSLNQSAGTMRGMRRVFADLWDVEKFYDCSTCAPQRTARITAMNHTQRIEETITCGCGRS